MAVSASRQAWFWGILLVSLIAALWLLGNTLMPFFLGAAIAYFLDPLADWLENHGLSRVMATAVIAIGAVILFVLAVLLVVPALAGQLNDLVEAAPGMFQKAQDYLVARFPEGSDAEQMLVRGLTTLQENAARIGPEILNTVLSSGLAVMDFVLVLVVAPVVAFYLLLDWDRLVAKIDGWLPRAHLESVRSIARDIDRTLAGFVRGQITVCLIQGTFYAIALTLIGLPFGFLVGMLAGLLAFIPYVGALVGGVLSMGIALFSFWGEPVWIAATAAIFAFGQFVEGNVLTPKLVGSSVGLHPVTLILALSVFGALFGFTGMLVAVPVAASLGVVSRFLIGRYLRSPLYTGMPHTGPDGPA
jgi:predicted PurR-regulated permease PerM